ncbi:hypothetical protein HORM4_670051 [Vibrio harveyi]|nr:hypothetical protein HORM4_670051 [Vibrio harveyi]
MFAYLFQMYECFLIYENKRKRGFYVFLCFSNDYRTTYF